MSHRVFRNWAAIVAVGLIALVCGRAIAQQAAAPSDAERKLGESLAAFIRAFNSHDAAALGKFWKPDAEHINKSTGSRLAGRQAIEDAYAALFKEDPKCTLQVSVRQHRFVTPTVATLECVADVRHASGDISRSEFDALLVQDSGNWLIDRVQEIEVPIVAEARKHLGSLEWLVGTWVDQSTDARVVNQTHWASNGNYLVRNYALEQGGAVSREGSQIIGWDAEDQCFRCWLFDTNGSFGEGTIQPEGQNKWVNKMVLKMANGDRASLTQVLQLTGNDKLTIDTTDREIDGAAQPNGPPVTLIRAGSEAAAPASPAASSAVEIK